MKTTLALLAASTSLASAIPLSSTSKGPSLNTRQSCENTATSRSCWGDYSIDTDWYETTPDTGVTREVVPFLAFLYPATTLTNHTVLAQC